jgi:ComF family protein
MAADYFCSDCHTPFLNPYPLDEQGRCMMCRLGLKGYDTVYTFGSYEDTLRELIHLFKYGSVRPLAKPLAALCARAIPFEHAFDVVAPMPLHWRKRWTRGYNQSELLAREIGRRRDVPVKNLVRRVKSTAAQAGLSNSKRRLNVQGAFALRKGVNVKGLRILLVDDVLTTGATASACARVLKRAGAKHVAIAAVARTDRRFSELNRENKPLALAARSGTS